MIKNEKDLLKTRLGLAILKVIQDNKEKAKENKLEGVKDIHLINSLRKLEAASGVPYASIQQITKGTKNASFTTWMAIIEGLNLTPQDFFQQYYDKVKLDQSEYTRKTKKKKP